MVAIERVEGTAAIHRFLDFPARLYEGDPAWVAPLREWQMRRFSPKNPFFRDAILELYVAKRGSEVVGTVSALRDRRWEQQKDEKTSFFGFFESEDDPEVAGALIATAKERAREWGMATLRGPRNLTRIEDVGITVEGHATRPPLLAGHHPPYYQALIEGLGFVKQHDVLAYDVLLNEPDGTPKALPDTLQKKSDDVAIEGLTIRRARYRSLSRDLRDAHHVFSEAFKTVPDTYPLPLDQFLNLGRVLIAFTDRNLMQIAYVNDEPVAFAICVPEMNEAIQRAHGRLLPLGWAGFAAGTRKIRTASFKLIGVIPEHRATGVHARLIAHVVDALRAIRYERLEASLIDERNGPMRRVVEGAGMSVYRRYRIYDAAV